MQAWENFLKLQETVLGVDTVNKWLRPLQILKFDACNLYLLAKDSFQITWFEEHIREKANTLLFNNNHKKIKVHLSLGQFRATTKTSKTKETEDKTPKFVLSYDTLDPHCTFSNYVLTESNELPLKLLSNITQADSSKTELGSFNPIFLYGPTGTGKTHLLMATANALRERGLKVIYVRAETFTEHVVTAIRASEMSQFRNAYRNIDALLIDDVQVFSRKGATQEEFFHTFNTLHLSGKQIILSSNTSPAELQLIEPRLISRFEWGVVLPLELPLKKELQVLLQKKSEAMNFQLHQKVMDFLLENFLSTKSLNRALEALILRSHMNPTPHRITVLAAKSLLEDLLNEEMKNSITSSKIIHTVAEFYGIKSEDILGKAQSRDCALPRQIAMHLCRIQLKLPFMKIGEIFSRDHSTVMTSVKLVEKGIEEDVPEIAHPVSAILKKLKTHLQQHEH